MPCGLFVHSRRFHSDHKIFINSFVTLVPQLSIKRVNIITDQKFRFAELFAVGKHLFCWNHMLCDLRWNARNKCNCTLKECNKTVNMFQQMMHCANNEIDECGFTPSSKMEKCTVMYHLCAFSKQEIERSIHQCGRWTVQDMYDFCKQDQAICLTNKLFLILKTLLIGRYLRKAFFSTREQIY